MIVTVLVGYDIAHTPTVEAQDTVVVVPTATPTANHATEAHEAIVETPETYIKKVFGEHYPKAMLLLQGRGAGSCAENRTLSQDAKNHNWVKGKPGVFWSTDWGIFQINDKFHPVEQLNLRTDWKANIDYAWRMFENDGMTFSKRWTCGKYWKSVGYEI